LTKIFVTGPTGFVGQEIVEELLRAGYTPRLLVRKAPASTPPNVEVHQGNILDASSIESGLKGIDAVIHLVGIISEAGNQTFENIHVKGTVNVIAAARKSGVKRMIHMSALGTRPHAVSRYHQSKWAAEEAVRSSGMDYTIFRPSLIFGPRDHFVNLFAKISRFSPVVPVIGRRDAKFQPVAVRTVAQVFVRSLSKSETINKNYDLCGPEVLTFPQLIDAILQTLHRERVKIQIPSHIARAQAALCEFIFARIFRTPPPLNRDQLIMLGEDNVGDGNIPSRDFRLENPSLSEGIKNYLRP
jgi:uncharacterized protein YbjT (DUF2867 family)